MAGHNLKRTQEKYIHRIDKLIETDASFKDLFKTLQASDYNELTQISRLENKSFDDIWIKTLEEGFVAIDNIVRNPSRFIKDERNITPIALAKRITSESVIHLASHTQYVRSVDEKGNVIPEKILSLSSEDDFAIYENRFIMTLIKKLVIFIEKRYSYIKKYSEIRNSDILVIKSKVNIGEVTYEYESKIKMSVPALDKKEEKKNDDLMKRIVSLRKRAGFYINSPFMETLKEAKPVRSPILMTNMLLKNQNYKAAYKLWKFLDTYEKLGVKYSVKETNAKFTKNYVDELYALTLASMLTLSSNKLDEINFESPKTRKKKFAPKVRIRLEDEMLLNDRLENEPIEVKVVAKESTGKKISTGPKELTQEEIQRIAEKKAKILEEKKRKIILQEQEKARREEEKEKLRRAEQEKKRLERELEKQKALAEKMQKEKEQSEKKREEAENKRRLSQIEQERKMLEKTRNQILKAVKTKTRKSK